MSDMDRINAIRYKSISAIRNEADLSEIAPHDTKRGMGRPPLKLRDPTVKTTIRLPASVLQRIKDASDDGEAAAFIRSAIESELKRRERTRLPSKTS
jgi:hypothetical protein